MRFSLTAALLFLLPPSILGTEVLLVTSNQLNFAVSHSPAGRWVVGDEVCAYRNGKEVACGTVVKVNNKGGIVRVTRKFGKIQKKDEVRIFKAAARSSFFRLSVDAHDWFDLRNATIGVSVLSPILHFQQAVSNEIAVGVIPTVLSSDAGAGQLRGLGLIGTINYYNKKPYTGLWIMGAGGAYLFNAEVDGVTEEQASLCGILSAGWRWSWHSGINLGAAAGIQYFFTRNFTNIDLAFNGFLPIFILDFGLIF